jgi:hypothetical protein
LLALAILLALTPAQAQIDPEKRTLMQFGYNQPLEGRAPLAGYMFYYRNEPNFIESNMVLRLAIAPVYADTELGIQGVITPHTDIGVGLAGGGFADSYYELHHGQYLRDQSFTGHGGEVNFSFYHLFDPGKKVPLSGILRFSPHYSLFERESDTAENFVLPHDHLSLNTRAGLRFGGQEPVMIPDVAMEISVWYENQYRTGSGFYGYNSDRELKELSHRFWARALLAYTTKNHKRFSLSVTAGDSINVDRFSAYHIGGNLPLSSEFPLILPGYYYQELTARKFVCFTGNYSLPLDEAHQWNFHVLGSLAGVDYLPGLEQGRHFNSGVGTGIGFRSKSNVWQAMATYGYGFQAERNHGLGGQTIGVLVQIDFEARHRKHAGGPVLEPESPERSRGLFRIFESIF